jgi:hypothetical protein
VDLTKFDFYAMRFAHSEVVKSMSAAEVGQYILLLCESWLTGKDASLPDDDSFLATAAKGRVTDRVLIQFPVVDTPWGARRRNQVLYAEWLATVSRSESASVRGIKGNEARWGNRNSDGSAMASVSQPYRGPASPKPSQAIPSQSDQAKESNFHNISIRYRAAMGKSHSKTSRFKDQYRGACEKYGEQSVLDRFDEWAESNTWRKEFLGNSGLRFFFSDIDEIMEEVSAANALNSHEDKDLEIAESAILAAREQKRNEIIQFVADSVYEKEQISKLKEADGDGLAL